MKATPDSAPASYDSVMSLYSEVVEALVHDSDAVFDAETMFCAEVERLAAQSAPTEQVECTCAAKDMPFGRCCKAPVLNADRAAAQVEPVRMLTGDDCREHLSRPWLTVEEDAAIAAFCAVNRGKRIPADGEVRNG